MKRLGPLVLFAALAALLAAPLASLRDDPPPEPIDCPLCAGSAKTHARTLRTWAAIAEWQIAFAVAEPWR
jgi:hypothetical protein